MSPDVASWVRESRNGQGRPHEFGSSGSRPTGDFVHVRRSCPNRVAGDLRADDQRQVSRVNFLGQLRAVSRRCRAGGTSPPGNRVRLRVSLSDQVSGNPRAAHCRDRGTLRQELREIGKVSCPASSRRTAPLDALSQRSNLRAELCRQTDHDLRHAVRTRRGS